MDLQSDATCELIASIQFYTEQYKHMFKSKEALIEHIHYVCEAVLNSKLEKN